MWISQIFIDYIPSGLISLESKVDKLDVDKLVPVPDDLSKLSEVVKTDVVKKDVYNANIKTIEDKIADITYLATNTTLNTIINVINNEKPSITNLATTAAFTAVENKIPTVSYLVKKAEYNAKISDMEIKCYTASDYNKFTSNTLDEKIKQEKLINEYDLNKNIKPLPTKE